MNVENFNNISAKINARLFKETIDYHMSLPRFAWVGVTCRMDTIPMLDARFRGMIKLSKQKYGTYNKAADNPRCKMHKKCFPWWHA